MIDVTWTMYETKRQINSSNSSKVSSQSMEYGYVDVHGPF